MGVLPLSAPPGGAGPCSRDEARALLQGRGLPAWYRAWRRGPLAEVLRVDVPYRLFEVQVRNAGRVERRWLAVDAVSGSLDPYAFAEPPPGGELQRGDGALALPESEEPERLRDAVSDRVRRQVYAEGFFALRGLAIEVEDTGRVLYLPYWVGVHRKAGRGWIEVLGGLRRGREGARLRDLIVPWVAA